MPAVTAKVWTTGRKWAGNILPALFYLPLAISGGIVMWRRQEFFGLGLWLLCGSVLVGWLALNFFGFIGNGFAKRQLRREINARVGLPNDAPFVGFARPGFRGALDPHEDLGFLVLKEDRLELLGESVTIELPRVNVTAVRFKPNIHTWVGLGRWISVEATIEGKKASVLIEPRERATMLGNLIFGKNLAWSLKAWRKDPLKTTKPEPVRPGSS